MLPSYNKDYYKQSVRKLEAIVREYNRACIYISMYEQNYLILNEPSEEHKLKTYQMIKVFFEKCFDTLQEEEKLIIKNDFFDRQNDHWWMGFYSRSSYYRIKNRAIQKLLYFYE